MRTSNRHGTRMTTKPQNSFGNIFNHWQASEASKTLLSVVNGKFRYVCVYSYIRETPKWAELSTNHLGVV